MTDLIRRVTFDRAKTKKMPDFKAGDTLHVSVRVKEGNKERTQVFKGVCLKVQNGGMGRTFTVRKISSGIGVERTFPFASPAIEKVEVISRGKVRRSRLFYLRKLRGRAARLESTLVQQESTKKKKASVDVPEEGQAQPEPAPAEAAPAADTTEAKDEKKS